MDISLSKKKRSNKKTPLHKLPPREVCDDPAIAMPGTAYRKKEEVNYMAAVKKINTEKSDYNIQSSRPQPHAPPSAAGPLISKFAQKSLKSQPSLNKDRPHNTSNKFGEKIKISIPGGKSMHGDSTTINEINAAIRSLETSTNRKLKSQDTSKRACNCIATRHPLLTAAPNCLSCGKVICVKEGLGPCTFCGTPLLSSMELKSMISILREERGREKMLADNNNQKRAEMSFTPELFSAPKNYGPGLVNKGNENMSAALQAKLHRDKLLEFQTQSASRTTVRDEVAEFITDDAELKREMLWASPAERAIALKKQQKLLQEMQWNARPEYERKKVVFSLDVVKGKVIKRFESSEYNPEDKVSQEVDLDDDCKAEKPSSAKNERQSLNKNPFLGGLTRPIWTPNFNLDATKMNEEQNFDKYCLNDWRRVQDEQEDNEALILDGGLVGTKI